MRTTFNILAKITSRGLLSKTSRKEIRNRDCCRRTIFIALQCGHNAPYTESDRLKLNHVLHAHGWLTTNPAPMV